MPKAIEFFLVSFYQKFKNFRIDFKEASIYKIMFVWHQIICFFKTLNFGKNSITINNYTDKNLDYLYQIVKINGSFIDLRFIPGSYLPFCNLPNTLSPNCLNSLFPINPPIKNENFLIFTTSDH
jgi:hypothetical protein